MISITCLLVLSFSLFAHASKPVVAHYMVGNTYTSSQSDWSRHIRLASLNGIDAFALNIGVDSWQWDRVADAYGAALSSGLNFKLFPSFDMTSLPGTSASDAEHLMEYISTYSDHPNSLLYNGKMFVSTFSGENCSFGTSSINDGWIKAVKGGPPVFFVPSFFVDPSTLNNIYVMDGAFNWNSGWPMGNYDIDTNSDNAYINNLSGRPYMAAISPWFFTHYGPDTYNKNFIYRGDNWLLVNRWELLIRNRDTTDMVEILTWNDYGESHYVGPVEGQQPHSEAWTTGFDHTGWLELMAYYIHAFKTGEYPEIIRDRVFLWARLYPAKAQAADSVGRPSNSEWTEDYIWAIVLLTSPAEFTLSCGPSALSTVLQAGSSKLKLLLTDDGYVAAELSRDGEKILDFKPEGFRFLRNPPNYNFNAFVAASP